MFSNKPKQTLHQKIAHDIKKRTSDAVKFSYEDERVEIATRLLEMCYGQINIPGKYSKGPHRLIRYMLTTNKTPREIIRFIDEYLKQLKRRPNKFQYKFELLVAIFYHSLDNNLKHNKNNRESAKLYYKSVINSKAPNSMKVFVNEVKLELDLL